MTCVIEAGWIPVSNRQLDVAESMGFKGEFRQWEHLRGSEINRFVCLQTMNPQIRKRTEPAFIEPMQCKAVTTLPSGDKRTFEIKFDGYRCIAVKREREIMLFSRNQKVLNKRFPRVVEALATLEGDFVLDGELVAFDSQEDRPFSFCRRTRRWRFQYISMPSIC